MDTLGREQSVLGEGEVSRHVGVKFKEALMLRVIQEQEWHLHILESKCFLKFCTLDVSHASSYLGHREERAWV